MGQEKNLGARKKILGQGKKSWGKRKYLAASEKILGQEKNCFVTLSRIIFLASEKNSEILNVTGIPGSVCLKIIPVSFGTMCYRRKCEHVEKLRQFSGRRTNK